LKQLFKKVLSAVVISAALLGCTLPVGASSTIYDMTDTIHLSNSVKYEKIRRLTTSGWQTIRVAQADLTDEHLSLKLLTNPESIHKLTNVKSLADAHDTVVAVNGDFFSWKNGSSGHGSSIGIGVDEGAMITSPASDWKFSTFAQREDGSFLYEYFDSSTTITAPDGTEVEILHTNKYTDLAQPVLYNHHWGTTSIGSAETIAELVVSDDKIQSVNYDMGPVEIPVDGYVITFLTDQTPELAEHFREGDEITLKTWFVPDFEQINFAIGAGTMLLNNGKATEITHDVAGAQPRTAVGTSKDGKTLYLVTVDGRQSIARGMTLPQLQTFLRDYRIYNAVNLDGGGSTTLVARDPEDGKNKVINTPSDGSLRAVANGIGVVSDAPSGGLHSLAVSADFENVFAGTGVMLHVSGRDANLAHTPLDINDVAWSATSGEVDAGEMLYYPEQAGKQTVYATAGNAKGSVQVNVLSAPARLELEQTTFDLAADEQVYVNLYGYTEDGYRAALNLRDVDISFSNPKVAGFVGNNIIAKSKGMTVVTFSYAGVTANALVTVDADTASTDEFEQANGTFLAYPAYVGGAYKILPDIKHGGTGAGKLWYDFRFEQEELKSANLLFANGGKRLSSSTKTMSVWGYSDTPASHAFKAMFEDADGEVYRITLSDNLDWEGWKEFTISLPKNAALPLTLTRLYVVQTDPTAANAGSVYIDDLSFDGAIIQGSMELPEDVKKEDNANVDANVESTDTSFRFAVFGNTENRGTLTERLTMAKFKSLFPGAGELAFFTGENVTIPEGLAVKSAKTSGFHVFDYKNATFITLDNSGGSIVNTDASQWARFLEQAEKIDKKNVFLFMPNGVNFINDYEKDLFYELMDKYFLQRGIALHVIYQSRADVKAVDGIRFYSTQGLSGIGSATEAVQNTDYLEISVDGNRVTYQYKKVF